MDKTSLEAFINGIEKLMNQSDPHEYVQDQSGCYSKLIYLQYLISETRELIRCGEKRIALENMLENLSEVSIYIDEDLVNLACKAFEGKIPEGIDTTLKSLIK